MPDNTFDGVGVDVVTGTTEYPKSGTITFAGEGTFNSIIQGISIVKGERVQEVVSFAEAQHVYTFGKSPDRLSINGFVFLEKFMGANASSELKKITATKLMEAWEKMRAKVAGKNGKPTITITISGIGYFQGIGQSLSINRDLNQEYGCQYNLSIIVVESKPPAD